jgi:HEPN domain-containing protein
MNELSEQIKEWIKKAEHDLGSAKIIFLYLPDYSDTIAFHCQQAVEKYIKAIMVYKEIEFQRSHDLIYLLELLSSVSEISKDRYKKAVSLNGYSVQIRYPDKIVKLSREELEDAIAISQEFRTFAIEQIGIEEINMGS